MPERAKMDWVVYILRCADDSLYTGITNDLQARLACHAAGTGAKYMRGRAPFTVMHTENCANRGDALRREAAVKRLTRRQKLDLIEDRSARQAASQRGGESAK